MALSTIMFCWAVIALLLGLACVWVVLTKRRTEVPFLALNDFSEGREEGRRMQALLRDALSGTETDGEFEARFRQSDVRDGGESEWTWAWLGRFLMEYRRADEFGPSSRTLATRFLEDIPRRYRLQEEPAENP